MNAPIIIIYVGLPSTGKSTMLKGLEPDVVISTDDIVQQHADQVGITYDEAWPLMIKEATKRADKMLAEALARGDTIIVDQTNLTVKKRKKILEQVDAFSTPHNHYKKYAMFFECDEETRQERLASREGKTIPKHVDEMMMKSYTRPSVDEGFDYVFGAF